MNTEPGPFPLSRQLEQTERHAAADDADQDRRVAGTDAHDVCRTPRVLDDLQERDVQVSGVHHKDLAQLDVHGFPGRPEDLVRLERRLCGALRHEGFLDVVDEYRVGLSGLEIAA